MRDPKKLRAFQLADELTLEIYRTTRLFPSEERFGMTNQIRRAAVSIGSNIVEGCGRDTTRDYVRFLEIAYGSACEVKYQVSIAERLGYLGDNATELTALADRTERTLGALVNAFRKRIRRHRHPDND